MAIENIKFVVLDSDVVNLAASIVKQASVEADKMILADSSGLVWDFDVGQPDLFKRWYGVSLTAKNADITTSGALYVGYRVSNFDTSNTGWTDYTFDITSDLTEKQIFINRSSKRLQIRTTDFSSSRYDLKEVKLLEPKVESNR